VLGRDPENLLDQNPGPLEEVEFWNSLAINLDSIFNQLQSEKVRRLLRYLDRAKSTYSAPFGKLCKEMFLARSKAKSNRKYLSALKPW
jgi:dynein heavy chain, axonemal